MSGTDVFDWKKFRQYHRRMTQVEDRILLRAFQQWMQGNDPYREMDGPEIEGWHVLFEAGWVASQVIANAHIMDTVDAMEKVDKD